jgi:hypothetical protein
MTLYEIGLLKSRLPTTTHPADFNRLHILSSCLESVGNFFSNFLEIPPASYWNVPLIHFTQLGYALNMLQRLSLFEDPVWDLHYAEEKVSFLKVVDQVCVHMEAVENKRGDGEECINIFVRTATRLRKLSSIFEAQLAAAKGVTDQMGDFEVGEGDVMDMDCFVGFGEQDWFDLMAGNWEGM